MSNTLSENVESRYKALTETQAIIDFLDKSRSASSRTHTTSTAPAPSLAPATVAFNTRSKNVISNLHSVDANPNHLRYFNARTEEELRLLAIETTSTLVRKQQVLDKYISDAERDSTYAPAKTVKLWKEKSVANKLLLEVVESAAKPYAELDQEAKEKRDNFYEEARRAWEAVKPVLHKINEEIVGPFSLGDQLAVTDLHLASWLARLVKLSGGTAADDGETAVRKLESHIGGGYAIISETQTEGYHSKLAAIWDTLKARDSWKKVYREGLY